MKTSNCTNVEGDSEKWDPCKILKGWRVAVCAKLEGGKRHCSETTDQTGELYRETRIRRFFKTDSQKPHIYANKNHIFINHAVGFFFFYLLGSLQELCGISRNLAISYSIDTITAICAAAVHDFIYHVSYPSHPAVSHLYLLLSWCCSFSSTLTGKIRRIFDSPLPKPGVVWYL